MGFKFKWQYLLVALCLFLVFATHLDFHKDYNYPLISDEWTLFSQAARMSYGSNVSEEGVSYSYVSALVLPISLIYKLGINVPWLDEELAGLLVAFSALCCHLLLRKRFGEVAGFAGMLFFASLPSNLNILGTAFFIPLTAAIPFIYLAVNLFENTFTVRNTVLFSIAWILIGAVHPLSFIYATLVFFIALVGRMYSFNKKASIALGIAGLAVSGVLLRLFPFLILNQLI